MPQRVCPYCGSVFDNPDKRAVFCSRKCANQSRTRNPTVHCNWCGREIRVPTAKQGRKFCGLQCRIQAKRKKARTCPVCSNPFMPKRAESKYCSVECRDRAHGHINPRPCLNCGKMFKPRYDDIVYCSRKCGAMSRSVPVEKRVRRSGHEFTRHQKKRILERDGYKCQLCSSTDRIQVDHIIPVGLGGQPVEENGQTLCHSCHANKTANDRHLIRLSKGLPD